MIDQLHDSFHKLIDKLSIWVDATILALPNILLAGIFLATSLLSAKYLKRLAQKFARKIFASLTVAELISNLLIAFFMLLVLFLILNILNLSDALTALLGTAGVAGLAVGLALQDPLINLFSGVLMSVKDYYEIGDLVETNGYRGKIQKINLRSTILMTPDGQEIVIPNREVLQNPLKNYSHTQRRRIDLDCGVSYDDSLEKVKRVAIKAIRNSTLHIPDYEKIEFYYTEFGDSSINFTLRFWQNISEMADYYDARDSAIIAIKNAFDKNGISIPFPIRTLDIPSKIGLRLDESFNE